MKFQNFMFHNFCTSAIFFVYGIGPSKNIIIQYQCCSTFISFSYEKLFISNLLEEPSFTSSLSSGEVWSRIFGLEVCYKTLQLWLYLIKDMAIEPLWMFSWWNSKVLMYIIRKAIILRIFMEVSFPLHFSQKFLSIIKKLRFVGFFALNKVQTLCQV